MEVHVVTMLFILALVIQVAQSGQTEFNLTTCGQDRMPCISNDTTEVPNFERENITIGMYIELPFVDLTELWLNDTKIFIVGSSGTAINFGKKLKSKQDKERYELNFYFTSIDSDWGGLELKLHVTDLQLIDTRPLRLELRLEHINYTTKGTNWMPVQKKDITLMVPVTQRPDTTSDSGQKLLEACHDNMTKLIDNNHTLGSLQKGNGWTPGEVIIRVLFCISLAVHFLFLSFKLYSLYKDNQQDYQQCTTTEELEAPWTIKA